MWSGEKVLAGSHFHRWNNWVFFKRSFDVDVCGLSCQLLSTLLASGSQACLWASVCDFVALPCFATNTSSAASKKALQWSWHAGFHACFNNYLSFPLPCHENIWTWCLFLFCIFWSFAFINKLFHTLIFFSFRGRVKEQSPALPSSVLLSALRRPPSPSTVKL